MRFCPLFIFLFALIGANIWFSWGSGGVMEERGVLGGPETFFAEPGVNSDLAVLEALSPTLIQAAEGGPGIEGDIAGFVFLDSATLANTGSLLGGALSKREGLLVYKVQSGDTLSKIASNFGISIDTILWANTGMRKYASLRPEEEITILPVTGILYEVLPGDTVQSVGAAFSVDGEKIRTANRIPAGGEFTAGARVVIPGGKPKKSLAALASAVSRALPDLRGYFSLPASKTSWNWGRLHVDNAVDIANSCGTDVYAAADGLVTEVGDPENWNVGYGGYIKIEHPNGTITLYSHTQENAVQPGNFVSKGDLIGKIGRTGNVHGPTGCHLHFEVHGARNPFAK